jgi:hypothetical protein
MGAKGVLYFCYWSPAGQGGFAQGGGVIFPKGHTSKYFNQSSGKPIGDISLSSAKLYRRGAHYRHARRLNSIVRNWGRYLLGANSIQVFHLRPRAAGQRNSTCDMGAKFQPKRVLPPGALLANVTDLAVSASEWTPKVGDGLLVGEFVLEDGRHALLLHNQNPDATLWPTIEFGRHVNASEVLEVDPVRPVSVARAPWPLV